MRFTAALIILALIATVVSGQVEINGTRVYTGSGREIHFNAVADGCSTESGGCDVDCTDWSSGSTLVLFSNGNGTDETSYTIRFHNFGTANPSQMFINSNDDSSRPLYVEVDESFSVGSLNSGPTGYLRTIAGSKRTQNSVVATVGNLYGSGNIDDSAFKLIVTQSTNLDGAYVHVAELILYDQASVSNSQISTDVGFLNSAVTEVDNSMIVSGSDLLLENPYGSDPTQTVALTCSGNSQINAQNLITKSPTQATDCSFGVNLMYITPALNVEQTNITNGEVPSGGNKKRDGSTTATTYNRGTSSANGVWQTDDYLNNLLKKRDLKSKRYEYVPYDNVLILAGNHQMTIYQQLDQQGTSPTIVIQDCDAQLDMQFSSDGVAQACPGCQTTCTNGVFKTTGPVSRR